MSTIKKPDNAKHCLGGGNGPHALREGMQNSTDTWGDNWQLLKKLNINLPYDLEIVLLRIFSREIEKYSMGQKKNYSCEHMKHSLLLYYLQVLYYFPYEL